MRYRHQKNRESSKSEQMARVRSKDTGLEILLRKTLWSQGFRYRVHPNLPGTPDLAFQRCKIAVFVDGCFWHGCPMHYTKPVRNAEFWQDKLDRNVSRDRRVDETLKALGWSVIRVWEHELKDMPTVVARIRAAINLAAPGSLLSR